MSEQLVPTTKTIVSMRDYARAVIRAWKSVDHGLPTKRAVAVLYAQYMMETGGAACWCWNIGNAKHVAGDGFDYCMLHGVWEGALPTVAQRLIASGQARADMNPNHIKAVGPGRVAIVFDPPHPETWFRAYPSLEMAMHSHLTLLAKKQFKNAWPAVVAGDYRAFAHALKAGRDGVEGTADDYFTAAAESYANGMRDPYSRFIASSLFDEELTAVVVAMEAETMPELPDVSSEPTIVVVFEEDGGDARRDATSDAVAELAHDGVDERARRER